MSPDGRVFPVAFDGVAMSEDLVRLGEAPRRSPDSVARSTASADGAVMLAVSHPERPVGMRVIAFGVRHHPRDAHALAVYEIAEQRIHD